MNRNLGCPYLVEVSSPVPCPSMGLLCVCRHDGISFRMEDLIAGYHVGTRIFFDSSCAGRELGSHATVGVDAMHGGVYEAVERRQAPLSVSPLSRPPSP